MGGRVLVTRPQPGAAKTARRLIEAGFTALVAPLSAIAPLAVDAEPATGIDAVVVTSANALRHMPPSWRARLGDLPIFVVGHDTAVAARAAGFRRIEAGPGNAVGLAGVLASHLVTGARVLYPCGRVRLADFERALADAGIVVLAVETYDTRRADIDAAALADALGTEPIAAVLHYSRETARAFTQLAALPAFAHILDGADHLCLSARVASGLSDLDTAKIECAETPDEDALFSLLLRQSRPGPRAGLFSA